MAITTAGKNRIMIFGPKTTAPMWWKKGGASVRM
jgi:hypothetical protein